MGGIILLLLALAVIYAISPEMVILLIVVAVGFGIWLLWSTVKEWWEDRKKAKAAGRPVKPLLSATAVKWIVGIAAALVLYAVFAGTGGGSSGRSWSDLSPLEQSNAKWAYEAQQFINGK